MTWSARITRPDGTNPTQEGHEDEDYSACMSCKHGQYGYPTPNEIHPKITPCNVMTMASNVGYLLTSIDIGADGHMACGEALLKCEGYEPKE